MANMFLLLTCGWMIYYTLNILVSLYRDWIWSVTIPFILVNVKNTLIYGYRVPLSFSPHIIILYMANLIYNVYFDLDKIHIFLSFGLF